MPPLSTMTAPQRAVHYVRWHASAYETPAPVGELQEQLALHHGLDESQAQQLLDGLVADGALKYYLSAIFEGYVLP